jgi:hypothetical protein
MRMIDYEFFLIVEGTFFMAMSKTLPGIDNLYILNIVSSQV